MDLELSALPLPPSVNRLYERRGGPGRGMKKTAEYVEYLAAVESWRLQRLDRVARMRRDLSAWLRANPTGRLHVDAHFRFRRGAVLCKDGRPKRNDTENRLKALLDAVAGLIGCDDSLFWSGSFDKAPVPENGWPSVTVRIIGRNDEPHPVDASGCDMNATHP